MVHELPVALQAFGIPVHENASHFRIGHARVAADDRIKKLTADDFPSCVDFQEGGFGQALFGGVEATDPVGELFGEHGDGAVWEIHAGASLVCILVERGGGANIVADIGDGDIEIVPAVPFLHAHRVV